MSHPSLCPSVHHYTSIEPAFSYCSYLKNKRALPQISLEARQTPTGSLSVPNVSNQSDVAASGRLTAGNRTGSNTSLAIL